MSSWRRHPGLEELAAEQDRVVARRQLRELKVSRHVVYAQVKAGHWQAIGVRVVVLHSGPLSRQQRLWVAVLHGGVGALLAGLTAAEADGLRLITSEVLHILVPRGSEVPELDDAAAGVRVKVHESGRLPSRDLHPARRPARTRLPRSLVDAASWSGTENRCRSILAAGVQQRLVTAEQLRERATACRTVPRRRLILDTIGDVEGGAHSLPELEWTRHLRRFGLPEPTRQRKVRRPSGTYYLDADFQTYGVTVEIDGMQHLELLVREQDEQRRIALAVAGRTVIALSSYAVRCHGDSAVLAVAQLLQAAGWVPSARTSRLLAAAALRLPAAAA